MVKNSPVVQETQVQPLGREDPLEEGMATHSSILAWRIPMDRGAWRATVHGVTESDMTEATWHSMPLMIVGKIPWGDAWKVVKTRGPQVSLWLTSTCSALRMPHLSRGMGCIGQAPGQARSPCLPLPFHEASLKAECSPCLRLPGLKKQPAPLILPPSIPLCRGLSLSQHQSNMEKSLQQAGCICLILP